MYTKAKIEKMNLEELNNIALGYNIENIVGSGKDGVVIKSDIISLILAKQELIASEEKKKKAAPKYLTGKYGYKMQLVRITNKDTREKDVPSEYVGYGNDFEEIRKIIAYEEEMQLEESLVNFLKTVEITVHIAEKDANGKNTGNRKPKRIKKYVVEVIEKEILIN